MTLDNVNIQKIDSIKIDSLEVIFKSNCKYSTASYNIVIIDK